MDSKPLVVEQIEAGAEFIKRLTKVLPVQGAFWACPSDKSKWFLYVVYDRPEDKGFGEAIAESIRVRREMQSPYLDYSRVKMVDTKDPQARELLDLYSRYPGSMPARYDDEMLFGTHFVDGLYMYPPPAEMAVT